MNNRTTIDRLAQGALVASKVSSDFLKLTQTVGKQIPIWTQGAGGNISEKIGDVLFIKASGSRLDEISAERGLAALHLTAFLNSLGKLNPAIPDAEQLYLNSVKENRLEDEGLQHPSMEAGLHAFINKRFVCHFHSIPATLMAHIAATKEQEFQNWWQTNAPKFGFKDFTLIPPVMPGFQLYWLMKKTENAKLFILQNHGVVLGMDNTSELSQWQELERQFVSKFFGQLSDLKSNEDFDGPLKIYFPDTAVYLTKLQASLRPTSGANFEFQKDPQTISRNLFEIWHATQILWRTCPELTELPANISSAVADLPTEKIRVSAQRS